MTPADNERLLVEDLQILPDAYERLDALISRAAPFATLPESARTDEALIAACQSPLWIAQRPATGAAGEIAFEFATDAPAVAALAGLFCAIYSGAAPGDIASHRSGALEALGLRRVLTPNRQQGAQAIIDRIQNLAMGTSGD